ncbi:thioesterase family protein [Williamsia sp. CHRR-6]|uniref:acyl-CoA thioesterase n=1 Tax=Williamsia sp. CHRR-6 TaxID=2835871 RepID=UPI001BD94DF8|nr:acyl-CoA thioesterase [Williamsia sp. CHRR-6]MBT0568190.1 acyl-CoA thioesterase [Williamsia sp. CHRR-6]
MSAHTVSVSLQLRWGDMNTNSHINNVSIARLFEESRVRAMPQLIAVDGASIPLREADGSAVSGLVVVRQVIEFLATAPYTPDDVTATVWLSRVGGSSFDVSAVLHGTDGTPFAQAESTLVGVGPNGSSVALPAEVAAVMRSRAQPPLPLRRS